MVIAYHVIFAAYGFWLPNDPRGSRSHFVGAWELLKFGDATGNQNIRRSVANKQHDHELRLAAKRSLKFPPVTFDGYQAVAIAQGFATACQKSGYQILACSILPEHVHAVIMRHDQNIEQIVGHLKGRATSQLLKHHLHPLAQFMQPGDETLTVWAERCWKSFLNTPADVYRAIQYVNNNPMKEHKKPQHWPFITTPNFAPPFSRRARSPFP